MTDIGNSFRKDYLLLLIISAVLGSLLVSQYALFQYFYSSKGTDLLVLFFFSVTGGVLSHLYLKTGTTTLHILTLSFVVIAALTKSIAFSTFHLIDLVSVITYFIAFFGTAIIINHLRNTKLKIYVSALLSASAFGFFQ